MSGPVNAWLRVLQFLTAIGVICAGFPLVGLISVLFATVLNLGILILTIGCLVAVLMVAFYVAAGTINLDEALEEIKKQIDRDMELGGRRRS